MKMKEENKEKEPLIIDKLLKCVVMRYIIGYDSPPQNNTRVQWIKQRRYYELRSC